MEPFGLRLTNGDLELTYRTITETRAVIKANLQLALSQVDGWTHVAAMLNTTTNTATFLVYSTARGTVIQTSTQAPADLEDAAGLLAIGSPSGDSFIGLIDEVRIKDAVQSIDDINGFRGQRLADGAGDLVNYFRFDDAGTRIEDHMPTRRLTAATSLLTNSSSWLTVQSDAVVVDVDSVTIGRETYTYFNTDSDSDGLPDLWETRYFGNLSADAEEDPDEDGLTNITEAWAGTNPTVPDTDGNGTADGHEPSLGSAGLSNLEKQTNGLRPDLEDTDDDGVADGTELANGTNPRHSASQVAVPAHAGRAHQEGSLDLSVAGTTIIPDSSRFIPSGTTVQVAGPTVTITAPAAGEVTGARFIDVAGAVSSDSTPIVGDQPLRQRTSGGLVELGRWPDVRAAPMVLAAGAT